MVVHQIASLKQSEFDSRYLLNCSNLLEVDGTGLPNQSDKVHVVGSNPTYCSKLKIKNYEFRKQKKKRKELLFLSWYGFENEQHEIEKITLF